MWLFDLMVALVVNVVPDLVLVLPDSGDKVPACPERAEGEFLGLLLEPRGGFALQNLHNVRDRVFGWDRDVEVDVLITHVPCVNVEFFPLRNILEHTLQLEFNVVVSEHPSAVFGTPDDVIITDPRCVGLLVQASVHG